MSVRFTKWNANQLLNKVNRTLEKAGPVYQDEAIKQIATPDWQWGWDTRRKVSLRMGGEKQPGMSGVVVYAGKRDIVDTGTLLASMTEPLVTGRSSTSSLVIAWTAPYARRVLEGGNYGSYIPPGQREYVDLGNRPGRNWIEEAYREKPPATVFSQIWRSFRAT